MCYVRFFSYKGIYSITPVPTMLTVCSIICYQVFPESDIKLYTSIVLSLIPKLVSYLIMTSIPVPILCNITKSIKSNIDAKNSTSVYWC